MTKNILFIEDHPVVRDTYTIFIDRHDDLKVCASAESAEEALDMLSDLSPDLLLVDVSLPGKSGIELVSILRSRGKDVPMLVLSGHDTEEYRLAAERAGADGFITKKDGPRLLIEAIRTALGNYTSGD